jgi:hypothetical protein
MCVDLILLSYSSIPGGIVLPLALTMNLKRVCTLYARNVTWSVHLHVQRDRSARGRPQRRHSRAKGGKEAK